MEMTFYDLIDGYEFSDLAEEFEKQYGDKYTLNACGFEKVYADLKGRTNNTPSDMTIVLTQIEACTLNDAWVHVTGKDKDDVPYSLGFTPWAEWLGMKINEDTALTFTSEEILVHCLWDMTFWGYDEEKIQNTLKKIGPDDFSEEELEEIEAELEAEDDLREILKDEISSSSED